MYSLVVMMALGGAAQAPEFGWGRSGCYSGGYGGYSSCYSGYGGYSGYGSCYSGYGGYSSCYSGYSSCYSPSYSYGYSQCYTPSYSYSHCYTPSYSYSQCYAPVYSYSHCYPVVSYSCAPIILSPGATPKSVTPDKGTKPGLPNPGKKVTPDEEASAPAPATIIVNLPADATLTVDGTATTSTSARRVLVSPELQPGQGYQYTLKAQVMRDGKPVVMEKKVALNAGQTTEVTLTEATAEVVAR